MDTHDKIIWICCSLSISGSLLVIIIYALSQKLKQMGSQFVLSQAVCDLLLACALLGNPVFKDLGLKNTETIDGITSTTWNCNLVGYVTQFSSQASVAWNFMLSIAIYRTVYAATKYQISSYSLLSFHAYVWISSFVNATILLLLKKYGENHIGCWINGSPYYLFIVLPLLVYFCGSGVVLVLVVKRVIKVTTRLSKSSRAEEYAFMIQVIKYIVVFLVAWSVPLAGAFLQLFSVQVSRALETVILLCLTLQGFANASVWLTSPKFLKACYDRLPKRSSGYQTFTGTDTGSERFYNNTSPTILETPESDLNYASLVDDSVPSVPQL